MAADYEPSDRIFAMNYLQQHDAKGEVVTGLLYADPDPADLHSHLNTVDTPFNQLTERDLCPGRLRWSVSTLRCARKLDQVAHARPDQSLLRPKSARAWEASP